MLGFDIIIGNVIITAGLESRYPRMLQSDAANAEDTIASNEICNSRVMTARYPAAAFSVYGMIPLFVMDDSVSGRMPRAVGSRGAEFRHRLLQ